MEACAFGMYYLSNQTFLGVAEQNVVSPLIPPLLAKVRQRYIVSLVSRDRFAAAEVLEIIKTNNVYS
jgi:hypothetical protein